ncbi:unnamed protein product [Nippostrongylus brasiliensis]|uniref:Secreted protein n=1 Tax=Nippostrongylus brasiliensis TaxID=27835 RepID=A0A0N4YAB5_NIPBR|nr:unnamed protein product [Nippostrongylus brasiliensis]
MPVARAQGLSGRNVWWRMAVVALMAVVVQSRTTLDATLMQRHYIIRDGFSFTPLKQIVDVLHEVLTLRTAF